MDLVSQAYRSMLDTNKSREAATILNGGTTPIFKSGPHADHYAVPGVGENESNAMMLMADTLNQNGFGHLYQDGNTNHFQHFQTGKRIKVRTMYDGDRLTHFVSRT